MVITNARHLFPRNNPLHIKPGLITCIFSEAIDVKGLTIDDLPGLKLRVYKIMEDMILNAEAV